MVIIQIFKRAAMNQLLDERLSYKIMWKTKLDSRQVIQSLQLVPSKRHS